MSAHTRTWNPKAALGPKPCKVNQQYRHKKGNQHVLAEEVPKSTNKNQIPSLRSLLSNHVQSVASPQYKHQLKRTWRRSSLISAFLKFISNQGQAQFAAWRDTLIRTKVSTKNFTHMIHIHFVSTESKPETHGIFYHFNPVRHLRSIVKL